MKKPSIRKRKSNINGQTMVDIKELPKRDPKVSFAESVNNLQLKLFSKDISPQRKASTKSLPPPHEDQIPKYNGLNNEELKEKGIKFKSQSNKNLYRENFDKNEKRYEKRRSMRLKSEKFSNKKIRGELSTIKEIIIADNNEHVVSNNPKKRFKLKDEVEKGGTKKKINIIEELRKFDREQQIKMEEYIDKKRKKQIELSFKNSDIYKIKNNENENENINDYNKNENINDNNNKIKINGITNNENKADKKRKEDNNNNKNNNNNNFQKIKMKYFSKHLFTTRFPETEFKTKYLDNYFQNNKEISKNLFGNYVHKKEETNKKVNTKNSLSKEKNNENSNNSKIDTINTINIEQSYRSNTYNLSFNKYNKDHREDNEINNTYKMIINSIDDKLYNKKNKNKDRIILPYDSYTRVMSGSIGKIKGLSKTQNNIYKSSFRDSALINKNNSYYKDISNKYDKYNRLKFIPHFIRNSNNNNNRNYNKDYKFIKIFNELKSSI